MPVLDFSEIPIAQAGAGRDQFELFAREFLELIGFRVIVGPDRGADAGRDLIVEEVRTGVAGETRLRWLVSCKHNAHSGSSVTPDDEKDIHDRVKTHNCDGFLGFYSTIQSSGLAAKLNAKSLVFEVQVFDQEKIEKHLLHPTGLDVASPDIVFKVAERAPDGCQDFLRGPRPVMLVLRKKSASSETARHCRPAEDVSWS